MSIEAGARAGLIAPDEKVYAFLKGRPKAPKGDAWDQAMRYWETLVTDEGAHVDREIRLDAAKRPPLVHWGTSPEQVTSTTGRVPGCSMATAMSPDKLQPGERGASTSNRNFEGRQGYKGRTHLVSPAMAAAAAIAGKFVDVRDWR